MANEYRINNFKISFKLQYYSRRCLSRLLSRHASRITLFANFSVLRSSVFVYTLFESGHVNCTKISDVTSIGRAILHLLRLFPGRGHRHRTPKVIGLSLDNISAHGTLWESSKFLAKVKRHLKAKYGLDSQYNPQKFPGLSVRINGTTFVLFQNGKFLAVGSKSTKLLKENYTTFRNYVASVPP